MLKRIRLTRLLSQDLEDFFDSGGHFEPINSKILENAEKKAKYFLKYGKYPKNKGEIMKTITQKLIKKQLIEIINKSKIEEIISEPRYVLGFELERALVGSTITIRTSPLAKRNKK